MVVKSLQSQESCEGNACSHIHTVRVLVICDIEGVKTDG